MDSTMSSSTAVRPCERGAAPEILAITSPELLMAAARRLVPPRSTPMEYSLTGRIVACSGHVHVRTLALQSILKSETKLPPKPHEESAWVARQYPPSSHLALAS